jgi:hypothetical protein
MASPLLSGWIVFLKSLSSIWRGVLHFFAGTQSQEATIGQQAVKRSRYTCGTLYITTEPAEDLDEWLQRQCSGAYYLSLEDMDDDLSRKTFKVLFENEADRDKLRHRRTG